MTDKSHAQDHQRASTQLGTEDAVNKMLQAMSSMFGGTNHIAGYSDFEGRKLNEMIDLVQHANPDDLTNAGDALFSARDAIKNAANELGDHIRNVEWQGESGTRFRDWGATLVKNTLALSDYADAAGLQISVAGSGLSSVRGSMPPRDTRSDQKTVEEIPAAKRVQGNPEYDEAVKVEGHRQEAINQMNRLASFYSVAGGTLAGQKAPTFEPMPDVGVPRPALRDPRSSTSGSDGSQLGNVTRSNESSVHTPTSHSMTYTPPQLLTEHGQIQQPVHSHEMTYDQLRRDAVTKIDHVAPPETRSQPPVDARPTPVGPPPGDVPDRQLPFSNGPGNPFANGPLRPMGNTPPAQARGAVRDGMSTSRNAGGSARGANAMGRGTVGRSQATGRAGTSGRTPMGRGISGGTPRTAGQAKSSTAGATRRGGVVGGRPTTGKTSAGSASRVSRGTVIGGEKETGGRPQGTAGKTGQRGVIGAPETQSNRQQPARRTPGASEGVIGAPKGRATGPKGERAGFTPGGSGLVRGTGDKARSQRHEKHEEMYEEGSETGLQPRLPDGDGMAPPLPQHRTPEPPAAD